MFLRQRFLRVTAIVLGLGLLPATQVDAASLIVNEGFESGSLAPGWFASNLTPTVTTDEAHTGLYSVAAFSADQIRQNFAATATSLITEVSIWVKRAGGAFNSYQFYYDDLTSDNFLIDDTNGSDDWTQFDLTSNLAVGKNLTGFSIFGTSPGPSYLDDVVISATPVPVPASLPMLLAGLGAIVVIRRKRSRAA